MSFQTESTMYEKIILSDIQGAWGVFRQEVVDNAGFDNWDRVLFHTDEAMGWEVVRDLKLMPPLVLIIRNLCSQAEAPEHVMVALMEIEDLLEETLEEYSK